MTFAIAIPALIILVIFAVFLIVLFASPLIEIAVNIPVLWVLFTRGYVEIAHGRKWHYVVSLAVSALIFILLFDFSTWFFVWWITQFLLLVFILAHLFYYIDKKKMRSKKAEMPLFAKSMLYLLVVVLIVLLLVFALNQGSLQWVTNSTSNFLGL